MMSNEALIQLIGLGQGAMLLVGIAGIGWLLKISSDVGAIKSSLLWHEKQKHESSKIHDELYNRVREVERSVDKCPNCSSPSIVNPPG